MTGGEDIARTYPSDVPFALACPGFYNVTCSHQPPGNAITRI